MDERPSIRTADLDVDLDAFRHDLARASDLVVGLYEGLDQARVTPKKGPASIEALFDEPLPEAPREIGAILDEVRDRIFANSTLCLSPRFFGYINGGGNQAAVLGELLASAINQICAKWDFSPAATEVERRVIQWISEFIGYGPGSGGCLLSGGSAGNLAGLAIARRRKATFDVARRGMRGGPALTVYVSTEGHASIRKSMVLLGMGADQLRLVPVLDDFTVDLEALEGQIEADRRNGYQPVCIVGNAGTTNTGAVDPLDALAGLSEAQGLWLHVDAAYGGPAAATDVAHLFQGLDRADSVSVNPHKWLYQPVEAGCILVRDPQALRDTFRIVADYLQEEDVEADGRLDFKDYSPQLSRGFRALKIWMTFRAYGATKLRSAIRSNIEIMRYLADRIDESPDLLRVAPVPLSTVCFQYRTADVSVQEDDAYVDWLNGRLPEILDEDGRVSLSATKLRGRNVLRACSVNHRLRREDVELLLNVIREVGESLAR